MGRSNLVLKLSHRSWECNLILKLYRPPRRLLSRQLDRTLRKMFHRVKKSKWKDRSCLGWKLGPKLQQAFIGIFIILVVAAIGGAVGGTHHQRQSSKSSVTTPPHDSPPGSPPPTDPQQHSACREGICTQAISTISWPGKRFIFSVASNKSLMCLSSTENQWDGAWLDMGIQLISPQTVTSWGGHRIDIFGVQSDGRLYLKTYLYGDWTEWIDIGGTWAGPITSTSKNEGQIHVFGAMPNGTIQEYWHFPGNMGNHQFGSAIRGTPTSTSLNTSHMIVLARGTDDALWYRQVSILTGYWDQWISLGGKLASSPLVISSQQNAGLDVFYLQDNGVLCWVGFRVGWLPRVCMVGGITFKSVPSPMVISSNRVDVIGLTTDDRVFHMSLINTTWGVSWDDLGGPINGAPTAMLVDGKVHVLGVSLNQSMYIREWDTAGSSWRASSPWTSLGGEF